MEFILLASAHFLALLSPGPDFFLILQTTLRLPLRYAISVCAGISLANGIYLAVAILGLEMVRDNPLLTQILKYAGALYLIYLGIMLLRAPRNQLATEKSSNFLQQPSVVKQFNLGCLSGILNPKNIIFYFSIFTVMVSPETPLYIRCLYGLWMTSIVFIWDAMIALCIGNKRVKCILGESIFYIEKISGIMLTFFGVLLTVR